MMAKQAKSNKERNGEHLEIHVAQYIRMELRKVPMYRAMINRIATATGLEASRLKVANGRAKIILDAVEDVKMSCNNFEKEVIDKYLCCGRITIIEAAAKLNCGQATLKRYSARITGMFAERLGV